MGRYMLWAVAATWFVLALPATAVADDANHADKADENFHAGRALLKDKRYADACPKFEESQRQDPASGTLLALAYCQELSGLLATSWANYLAAAQLAEREGQTERQSAAAERARALRARVSKLTVVVPPELLSLPGFHLLRDGIEFERASFGIPTPLDGGSHTFVASAPQRASWTSTVILQPEHDQKTLVLPILDPVAPAAAPSSGSERSGRQQLAPDARSKVNSGATLKRASLAFAAASLVGLGVGTAFGLSAKSKNDASNANGHCDNGCDPTGIELRQSAQSAAQVSTWAFVATGALAACSLTLYLTGDAQSSSQTPTATVGAHVSLGAPSITVSRAF